MTSYSIYKLLGPLLIPLALIRLLLKTSRESNYLKHISERFGFCGTISDSPLDVWIHAVSVGEIHAAQPIIEAILKKSPRSSLTLTCSTPAGRRTAQSLFASNVHILYVPFDIKSFVNRFIKKIQPKVLIVLETEIWPTMFNACKANNIDIWILNGRMSKKSFHRYLKFRNLTKQTLQKVTAVLAQTQEDADRFITLGAKEVRVTGNLKYDRSPPPIASDFRSDFRAQIGNEKKIFLAASTRDGEEEILLRHLLPRIDSSKVLLVIVPRHPHRFGVVEKLISQLKIAYAKRSQLQTLNIDSRVMLGDSMGELYSYYRAADVVFVGGSLLDYGGQNPIEAFAVGKRVIVGPYTFNFSSVISEALGAGIAIQAENLEDFVNVSLSEINKSKIGEVDDSAIALVRKHQGATETSLSILRDKGVRC